MAFPYLTVPSERYAESPYDVRGFYAYLSDVSGITSAQIMTAQGWQFEVAPRIHFQNERDNLGDEITGESCLFFEDTETNNPRMWLPQTVQQLSNDFNNGFTMRLRNRVTQSTFGDVYTGSSAATYGWNSTIDPRQPVVYHFDRDIATRMELDTPVIIDKDGGTIEFTVYGFNGTNSYILGGDDSAIYVNNDGTISFSVGGVVSTSTLAFNPGQNNHFYIERRFIAGANMSQTRMEINGANDAWRTNDNADFTISWFGAGLTSYARIIALSNVILKESVNSAVRDWGLLESLQTIQPETNGTNNAVIVNHNPALWKTSGVGGRLLVNFGNDNAGNQGMNISDTDDGTGNLLSHTAIDSAFVNYLIRILPTPDNNNWGSLELYADGVLIGSSATWINSGSQDFIGYQSGSSANADRFSKLSAFQILAPQDNRDYIISPAAFRLNFISGTIGGEDVIATIPISNDTQEINSSFNIDFSSDGGSTPITIICEDPAGIITDGITTGNSISFDAISNISGLTIFKDTDHNVTPSVYMVTALYNT